MAGAEPPWRQQAPPQHRQGQGHEQHWQRQQGHQQDDRLTSRAKRWRSTCATTLQKVSSQQSSSGLRTVGELRQGGCHYCCHFEPPASTPCRLVACWLAAGMDGCGFVPVEELVDKMKRPTDGDEVRRIVEQDEKVRRPVRNGHREARLSSLNSLVSKQTTCRPCKPVAALP
jgi:hypothetical protein